MGRPAAWLPRLALPPGGAYDGLRPACSSSASTSAQRWPLHFVVEGDLHLTLDGVFLHRHGQDATSPATTAVSAEAAFVAFCAEARTDRRDQGRLGACSTGGSSTCEPARRDPDGGEWRRGVPETSYVLPFLDGRCRSMPEAELLAYVVFAGLPMPRSTRRSTIATASELTPDQWFADYELACRVRGQPAPGGPAAVQRRHRPVRRSTAGNASPYEQVTKERLRSPKATVRHGARARSSRCGYDGPPPDFEACGQSLFMPLPDVVRASAQRDRRRAVP